MKKCVICGRTIEEKEICLRCGSILKDIVVGIVGFFIGIIYIISPWDILSESLIGLFGLSDDVVAILLIIGFEIYTIAKVIRKCL